MTADEWVHSYRLTNVAFAALESSERIRFELMNLRHMQIISQQKSIKQRLVAALLTAVAAIPALYGLLPKDLTELRIIWLTVSIALALAYLYIGCQQLKEETEQAQKIKIPVGYDAPPEKSPEFLMMQLSSYRTRWEIARSVLKENPAEPTKTLYTTNQDYWADMMRAMPKRLQSLVQEKKLSESDYDVLLHWIPKEVQDNPTTARTGATDGR
ncbi:MAG: hypothetical protein QOH06_3941 [Acidobacteriota bacterium]|jgi:hypothetical protein|nr:hypothetical protein [Acidobacteriota bacterium]